MKAKHLLYPLISLLFISCGEDRTHEYEEITAANQWIEKTMREKYYWYEDMPKVEDLNFFLDSVSFFNKLLSDKDGKPAMGYHYSYMESTAPALSRAIYQPENSYGFDFELFVEKVNTTSVYYARVLYVDKDSPASEGGLKRGDWIMSVGDAYIDKDNYTKLYNGGAVKFAIGKFNLTSQAIERIKDIDIPASRAVEDNPVYYDNTYTVEGKKVGYLVYNHFTDGRGNKDKTYDNELLALSQEFKSENVSEFVLDLRYNPGGLLTSAMLLSAILAPEEALDKTFGYMRYNNKWSPREEEFMLEKEKLNGGANLNLKRLYVLTTSSSASASELLIYCLSPYMEVITIGETTEGKNVGSISYTNEEVQLILHPIVGQIYNVDGDSDYADGIEPDYECRTNTIHTYYPFGDWEHDIFLNTAFALIAGREVTRAEYQSRGPVFTPVHNSLSEKAVPGVVIR